MSLWLARAFAVIIRVMPQPFRKAVRGIRDIIRNLWRALDQAAKSARSLVNSILGAAARLGTAISRFVRQMQTSLRHIYDAYVPQWFRNAVNTVKSWASSFVNTIANGLRGLIGNIRRFLEGLINTLRQWARSAVDWLRARINDARNLLNTLIDGLHHVLGGPRRLAEWLIGALVSALWRYVQRNELAIGRWLRTRSVAFTMWAAERVETLLGRLL